VTFETPPELEGLLDYLHRSRGFDFGAYKRATLMRRIQKRMQGVGVRDFTDYVDYLEVHPEEFPHLFNTILINVTAFFRDPAAWDYLAADVVPQLASQGSSAPIRVWSAGCASGEEAYTIAMVLAERLGGEEFRARVKIYATDVDEEALGEARLASYGPKDVEEVPAAYLEKYFERSSSHYVFHKDFRRSVIFGRHDLVQDAPISRIDLLVSRNTLMYFNSETQSRILDRFHFALREGGFLFLGKAEMLLTHGHIFTPVDLKRRVFVKVPHREGRARLLRAAALDREGTVNHMSDDMRLRSASFDVDPVAAIVVDAGGVVAIVNDAARVLFGLTAADVGRPLRDLSLSYRPTNLPSAIEEVLAGRRSVVRRGVSWVNASGETVQLDVSIVPVLDADGTPLGTKVLFGDASRYRQLQDELQQSKQALETAYEELQSSNEELETTNEELQSSNEELETTNEELQSTNEELETMNEELQSTNEELETINSELRQRTDELNSTNAFLASILSGLRAGVVVIDRDLQILVWNERAEDLWGLRTDEVQGRHLLNLDIGLPVGELRQPVRRVLAGESRQQQLTLDATNRRGRAIRCTVTCTPLDGSSSEPVRGAIVLMEVKEEAPSPA
jgi:two-component system, chemotaxis family, CheB/CheR fusion protein